MVVNINGNWIKLFSKFMNWEWYTNANTMRLFIHCLLKANWKDGKFEGIEIKRGSFATSLQTLMKELGMSKQEVRTAIKHLISTHEITQTTYPKFTVISIENYNLYQEVNTVANNQLTQEQHRSNTGATPIEEYKNIEYKTNSVCNNACEEDFNCHLGCLYKTMNCKDCMKKWKCPLPDDPTFKGIYGQTFYEYIAEIERRKIDVGMQLDQMTGSSNPELADYDWLNDKGDKNNES